MDALKGQNKHSGSGISERKKSLREDGPGHLEEEDGDDHEDYFQTLVTRGAARGVLTVHVKSCTDFKSRILHFMSPSL